MRAGIVVNVTRADRLRLEAIIADRSTPQKHVWRANVILATADGCGTAEILDRAGAVHGGGRRRAVARQDAQAWQAPAAAQHRSAGSRFGLGAAAGREHPLDGPGTCQGGRSEPVEKLRNIVGLYVDPPAHAVAQPGL